MKAKNREKKRTRKSQRGTTISKKRAKQLEQLFIIGLRGYSLRSFDKKRDLKK